MPYAAAAKVAGATGRPLPNGSGCDCSSQLTIVERRKRHCLPTLMAGSALHSAQRQTVRRAIPSHFDTSSVVSKGSSVDFCDIPFPSGRNKSGLLFMQFQGLPVAEAMLKRVR